MNCKPRILSSLFVADDCFKRRIATCAEGRKRRWRVNLRRDPGAIVHRPGALPVKVRNVCQHLAVRQREDRLFADEIRTGTGRLAVKNGVRMSLKERCGVLRGGERARANDYKQLSALI